MTTALVTRVPAFIDALIGRLRTLTGVQVVDGPPGAQDLNQRDVIVVGMTRGDYQAASITRAAAGMGPRDAEVFTIDVTISCVQGEGQTKAARDRAAELLGELEQLLADDRTLGGVCALAELGPSMVWSQQPSTDGVEVAVRSEVQGRAL